MKLPKEEAETLRRCISILAPMHSVSERQTMALHVERRISGQEDSLLAFHFNQLAALFYPSDAEKANQLAQQLQTAADAGEFATKIPPAEKGAFISDLAVWPQCPPIPSDSPLRYWMPFKGASELEPAPLETKGSELGKGVPSRMSNRTKPKRRDTITVAIEDAQTRCKNPLDGAEVYAEMEAMARAKKCHLLGVTEEGIQWLKNDTPTILKRTALSKPLQRITPA